MKICSCCLKAENSNDKIEGNVDENVLKKLNADQVNPKKENTNIINNITINDLTINNKKSHRNSYVFANIGINQIIQKQRELTQKVAMMLIIYLQKMNPILKKMIAKKIQI